MKINVYVLHGMWTTPDEDNTAVIGVSADEKLLIEKLDEIAKTKASGYIKMHGYIHEEKAERSYQATNGRGKCAVFRITEHQMDLPGGTIVQEAKDICLMEDVRKYLKSLHRSGSIGDWEYEYITRNQEVIKEIVQKVEARRSDLTPLAFTMQHVVMSVAEEFALDNEIVEYLWDEFRNDVMADDRCIMTGSPRIKKDFLGIKEGSSQKIVYRWFDENYTDGIARLIYKDMEPLNTKITYLYRDACNYKQHNEIVIPGTFSMAQIDTIMGCLSDGEYFIPGQVGFPEVRFGELTEDDHCWFELSEDGFEATNETQDADMTPDEVVSKFLAAKGNWDDTAFGELL